MCSQYLQDRQSSAWWSVGCWENWIMEFGLMNRPRSINQMQGLGIDERAHLSSLYPQPCCLSSVLLCHLLKAEKNSPQRQPWKTSQLFTWLCNNVTITDYGTMAMLTIVSHACFCVFLLSVPLSLSLLLYISTRWVAFEWPSLALIAPINLSRFTLA